MTRTTPDRPVDIEAIFPELAAHRSVATRLHPRPGAPTARQSSVGGPFLWPTGEPWPTCREPHPRGRGERLSNVRARRRLLAEAWSRPPLPGGEEGPTDDERQQLDALKKRGKYAPWLADDDPIPMLPVAQLYTGDVPGLDAPEGADLLQVLWCPFDAHGADRMLSVRLVWRASAEVTSPLESFPQLEVVGRAGYVPEPCLVHPEQVVEHPYVDLLPPKLGRRIEAWEDWDDDDAWHYQYDLSIAPGWKVGGFASWHLTGPGATTCECGSPMRLLLTMDSKEWDGGSRSWMPVEDRQSAGQSGVSKPTEIIVGAAGSLRIFVCPANPEHPFRLSEQ